MDEIAACSSGLVHPSHAFHMTSLLASANRSMLHRHLFFPALGLLLCPRLVTAQALSEGAEALAVVARMFQGMRTADSAMVRATFASGARFASIDARATPAAITYEQPDGWLSGIAKSAKRWDERLYDVQVRVDANIAQVWAPYTFYLDGKIRHCGVDAIELLRDTNGWKITQLSDTQRREGCREVPAPANGSDVSSASAEEPYFEYQVERPVATLVGSPMPVYPAELKAAKVEGEVLAQFVVGTDGAAQPATFRVLKSNNVLFTEAVRTALPRMHFSPAVLNGKKVPQLVQQPFTFAVSR
jgi:TonB family protein